MEILYLYKIISPDNWQKSLNAKHVIPSPIDTAFFHLATKEQINHVIEKFWKQQPYLILKLSPKKLMGRLVLETNPGGFSKYYHLYEGRIPLDAVIEVISQKDLLC